MRAATPNSAPPAIAISHDRQRTLAPEEGRCDVDAGVGDGASARALRSSPVHASSSLRSAALCQRFDGSLARHFLTTRSKTGGVRGCNVPIRGGSDVRIAAITAVPLV